MNILAGGSSAVDVAIVNVCLNCCWRGVCLRIEGQHKCVATPIPLAQKNLGRQTGASTGDVQTERWDELQPTCTDRRLPVMEMAGFQRLSRRRPAEIRGLWNDIMRLLSALSARDVGILCFFFIDFSRH